VFVDEKWMDGEATIRKKKTIVILHYMIMTYQRSIGWMKHEWMERL
jgi:hypothetical protein